MKRPLRPALLIGASLIALFGCTAEPSPLSPRAELNPEKFQVATREMAVVAQRNKEAEAAFYRKLRTAPPATPDAIEDRSSNNQQSADTREKP